jgi:hypothetical protein
MPQNGRGFKAETSALNCARTIHHCLLEVQLRNSTLDPRDIRMGTALSATGIATAIATVHLTSQLTALRQGYSTVC